MEVLLTDLEKLRGTEEQLRAEKEVGSAILIYAVSNVFGRKCNK